MEFWALTQHQLRTYTNFDDRNHRFHLQQNVINEAPLGYYQLIARGQSQSTGSHNTHVYRLNHPLGEWVLDTAKHQPTPSADIQFDYAAHGAKISVIEALLGQSGILKLQRFSIEKAPTLAEKLSWQKQQQELERARNKQRKELFDLQDEVDERREALIEQLESKLNQKTEAEDLFIIRWHL